MKKKKIWIIATMLAVLFSFNVQADDGILSFLDFAENTQVNSFWYSSDDRITIKYLDKNNSSIDVESPVIKNSWIEVDSYLFIASEEEKANKNPVAMRCFSNINVTNNKFIMNLEMSSNKREKKLDESKTYYIYARPIDLYSWPSYNWPCSASEAKEFLTNWVAWTDSTANWEDPCVNISNNIYWVDDYCEKNAWNNWSSSNWQTNIYSISNISFICNNDNTVTATRNSWADVNIDVFLRNDNKELFEKIWTVNSEKKAFTFTPNEKNHFSVRFEPVDWTQKINEDWHCLVTTNPEVTPTTPSNPVKPPVVWPKENILIIIIGTIVLYIIYRIAKRKA